MATPSSTSNPTSTAKSTSYNIGEGEAAISYFDQRSLHRNVAYLIPHLTSLLEQRSSSSPNTPFTLLDAGCGPGSITLDFARLLAPHSGRVVGLDTSSSVLSTARQAALAANLTNVTFIHGTVEDLHASAGLASAAFDVVHAHQVLIHLADPVAALREMRRVCKPGGLVASRDAFAQKGSMVRWPPPSAQVQVGMDAMMDYLFSDERDCGFGKRLLSVALQAGFRREEVEFSVSMDLSVTRADKAALGDIYVAMVERAAEAGKGGANKEVLEAVRRDAVALTEDDSAWTGYHNGQIVCHVGE